MLATTNNDGDVFDWLQYRLRHGLSTWRKPGTAGWIWMTPGTVARVLVWCTGSRESEQTEPYTGELQYGARWWPCIVHIPANDPFAPVLAFYCPALGWAKARPWLVHRSRCFLIPNDYRARLNPAPIKVDNKEQDRHTADGSSTSTGSPSVHTSSSSTAAPSSAGSSSSCLTAESLASLAHTATTDISTASAGFVTVNGVTFLAVNSFDDIEGPDANVDTAAGNRS